MSEYVLIACLLPVAGLLAWFGLRASRKAAPVLQDAAAIQELVTPPSPVGHASVPAADSADERWTAFLIGMSHELRTPLNAVIGFTEMLTEAELPDTQAQQVRLIADSGRSMLRLVNDILDIAKVRAGQLRLVEEDCDLRAELAQVVAMLRPIAMGQNVNLDLEVADDVPERQVLDRLRLRQVLLNLLSNALKATEDGSVVLHADLKGDTVHLRVSDTGSGIAPERLATLFKPFAEDVGSPVRTFCGTGLGLPLCAEFVALMGGTITVESTPGKGSTFTVSAKQPAGWSENCAEQGMPPPGNGSLQTFSRILKTAPEISD